MMNLRREQSQSPLFVTVQTEGALSFLSARLFMFPSVNQRMMKATRNLEKLFVSETTLGRANNSSVGTPSTARLASAW